MNQKSSKTKRILLTAICGICVVLIALICVYMLWEDAPNIADEAPSLKSSTDDSTSDMAAKIDKDSREDGVYTILLVGNDNGFGNTDTIIVGKVDTENHTMNFLSIPRDTLMNVDWEIRKINSAYAAASNSGGVAIDGLKTQVKNLIGYTVDCYAVIDLNVFIETIDLLGGVYFDVPMQMDYEDPAQNLYIHLAPGYQLLNGEQCMELCRYRSGYADGDLGRVNTQHAFLKAMAEQFISLGNIPNISKILDLLTEHLDTDLDASNIAFFLRQALKCKTEDINFYTLPNTPDTVYGLSYVLVDLYNWLPMLNTYFNPYDTEIAANNLNLVYLDCTGFGCTQVLQGAWYFSAVPPDLYDDEPSDIIITPEPLPTEAPIEEPAAESSQEHPPAEQPEADTEAIQLG